DAPGTPGCADNHNGDTRPPVHASPPLRVRRASPGATRSAMPISPPSSARMLVELRCRARVRTRLGTSEQARLPFFCGDLLHDLNLKITFRQQLLQPCVLAFHLAQTLHVHRLELAEALAPAVDRDIADPMLLGDLGHRGLVRLPQDLDHLPFVESGLLHGSSLPEDHFPKFQLGRKSPGRSVGYAVEISALILALRVRASATRSANRSK